VTRVTVLAAVWLCVGASLPLLHAQVAPPNQGQQPPADIPQPPATNTNTTPAPVVIDPKTGLPVMPADVREQEIDKFDPMKRNVNPVAQPDASPLTDRQQPGQAADPDAKPKPQSGSDDGSGTKSKSATKSSTSGDSTDDAADAADDAADTNGAAYSGPAVLTRSYTLAMPMIPHQVRWAASVGVGYTFDDGETPTVENGQTVFVPTTSSGRSLNWSFSGRHIWRHDQIGVSYSAGYSQFGIGALGGINNTLGLDYAHVLSRRITLHFVESVSDLSQNYSLQNPNPTPSTSIANINLAASPSVGLLNSTSRQSSSSLSVSYRQTSRISYSFSSSFFISGVTGGVGMTGSQFGADVNYRWTRKATVGAYYSYNDYQYSHNIATSDSNGVGLIFSYAIDRYTQLRTRFGVSRIETLGYESVPLSPGLAALLGQSSTIINAYTLEVTDDISVELVRDFRRTRTGTLSYVHGESPGNGVLLTSIQQSFNAGYSMNLFRRRLPLNANASYTMLNAVSQGNMGYFKSETASVGTSRRVATGVNSTLNIAYRRYQISGTPLQARDLSVSLGVNWGVPLRKLGL
jgi:hypothetical protein